MNLTPPVPTTPRNKRLLLLLAGAGVFVIGLVIYLLRRWNAARVHTHALEGELAALRDENGVLNDLLERQNTALLEIRTALDGQPAEPGAERATLALPPLNFGLSTRIQPVVVDGQPAFRAWGKHTDRFVQVRIFEESYTCDLTTHDDRQRVVRQYVGAHPAGQPDLKKIGVEIRQLLELPIHPSQASDHEPTTA